MNVAAPLSSPRRIAQPARGLVVFDAREILAAVAERRQSAAQRDQRAVEGQHVGVRRAVERLPAQLAARKVSSACGSDHAPMSAPVLQQVQVLRVAPLANRFRQRRVAVAGEVVERRSSAYSSPWNSKGSAGVENSTVAAAFWRACPATCASRLPW